MGKPSYYSFLDVFEFPGEAVYRGGGQDNQPNHRVEQQAGQSLPPPLLQGHGAQRSGTYTFKEFWSVYRLLILSRRRKKFASFFKLSFEKMCLYI
jgi:hypothetical protein